MLQHVLPLHAPCPAQPALMPLVTHVHALVQLQCTPGWECFGTIATPKRPVIRVRPFMRGEQSLELEGLFTG